MNRKIIIIVLTVGLVILGIGLGYSLFSSPEKKISAGKEKPLPRTERKASIEIINSKVDLGTFRYNESKKGEYIIHNNGSSPLIILKTVSSCNCTKIEYPKKPIPPGDTARIVVTYTPNSSGKVNKTIDLHSNTTPQVNTLRIEGMIVK